MRLVVAGSSASMPRPTEQGRPFTHLVCRPNENPAPPRIRSWLPAVLMGVCGLAPLLVRPIRLITLDPELPERCLLQTHGAQQLHN